MNLFERILGKVASPMAVIAIGCFLIIMVIVTLNVITRVFNVPIPGVYELTALIMMGGGALALAYAALHRSNVEIEMVKERLPKKAQKVLKIFSWILSTLLWAVVCWQSIRILVQKGFSEHTEVIRAPYGPSRIIYTLGLAFLAIICAYNIVKTTKEGKP